MLDAGYPLSDVTAALCERWQPGVRLLPMTDERCETHVVVETRRARGARSTSRSGGSSTAPRCRPRRSSRSGWTTPTPAPGVLDAIAGADVVLIAPSNPVVSIGTILGVPGIRDARRRRRPAPVVGLSPIIGGAPVRGMADACLPAIGVEVSAEGVGRHYGARTDGGLLDGWLVHDTDTRRRPRRRRCARCRC